ncbi:Ligand-binding domain of nuclear hormone receptor [Onchocerca flexuosa]|uniref:Ligand-binding domain of nuclear hormone receptor n=2 Tax=Onchocerca flexuosa TaxID=387005 RepID=A0A238C183_9BILA|nr:Ligand-binding domain of nuclear hormone receptor [Onchocerca flexuosa]
MRGGRNKFGSYYKRDRAQRMQRIALRANGTHNFFNQSSTEQQVSSSTPTGIAATAAATAAAAVHAQYFDASGTQKFKNDYDALLQSPTLSSSTQSPTNYVMPRPSAYLPNCDNLAALLGSSIDDPLLRSSSFPIYSCVKPEPFDGYTESNFPQPSLPTDYSPFCPPTSSYTAMTAMAPVAVPAATPTAGTTADRSSPLLPICPLPTEKTIDSVFYAPKQTVLLCSCTESLLDPNLLLHLLGKGDKTRDAFQFCKSVIEESLNSIVTWAKNAPYFEHLPVDDQIALIYTSWAPIHVLDFTFHILHSHLPISIQFGNNPLPVSTICLMGFDTLAPKFNDLCSKLQSLNFDRCDYAAFKVLTLFEHRGERSAINNCALTAQVHASILAAWAAYRSVPNANDHPLYAVYEELKLLARQAAHLLSKYSTVGMEENLLKEMLTRKEHHLVSQQPPSSIPPPQQQYA